MSEEIYNTTERVILISILYGFSFAACLIYFCCKVDSKITSPITFLVCLLYASTFVFLNLIASIDWYYNNIQGFEKLMKFILNFYQIFSYIDKAFGFFIINLLDIWICYLESGYYSKFKKLFDYYIRKYNGFKKKALAKNLFLFLLKFL